MLNTEIRVEMDPENALSVRLVGGRALDFKTLVCQVNGDQKTDMEREDDCRIIVNAINKYLASG